MWWILGAVCNAVIATAYLLIVIAIVRPLVRSRQLSSNAMAAATAAIFLTCAVHHGAHVVHMLMPFFGVDLVQGDAMRTAWGPELAIWDLVGAVVATYYWTLRGGFAPDDTSPQLFTDQHEREQQALELNDAVLQGMVAARMAFELGETRRAESALDASIAAASSIITDLIGGETRPGNRPLRSSPALVEHGQSAAQPHGPGGAMTDDGPLGEAP